MQNEWRVIGLWRGGRTFLLVTGASPSDCRRRLPRALEEYTDQDFDRIESIWYEFWDPGTAWRLPSWIPFEELEPQFVAP